MVRDGVYVSEDDAAMRLTGVYVPATGRLLAVAEPAAPVLAVPLDAGEGAESLDYRWAPMNGVASAFWTGTWLARGAAGCREGRTVAGYIKGHSHLRACWRTGRS